MNNFITAFRESETAQKMGRLLSGYTGRSVKLMEVCGTHTMAIFRYGIRALLPEGIGLISGPGCPVCVTPGFFIDTAIALSERRDVILATFGDMMRVPGSSGDEGRQKSLLLQKAAGSDIRVVYSPLDALRLARENTQKKVVFLSIGFETTTPVVALTVLKAAEEGLGNFSVLSANKTVPKALQALSADGDLGVDGYLYPGHVSAIIGTAFYAELAEKYGIPGIVTGFEPLDILYAILTLVRNINAGRNIVENQYARVVASEGNPIALQKMNAVFEPCDAVWRGIGNIPLSGLKVRESYARYDAWRIFDREPVGGSEPKGCKCGDVLKGKCTPRDCGLFGERCTPENPVGACMVSTEGTCAAYYKYGGGDGACRR